MKVKKVLVGGCFDILHYGHIHFLKKAASLGNLLVVALESDANVKRLKGSSRPIHNQTWRKEMLESLSFVSKVIILKNKMNDRDYADLVKTIRPDILAVTKGDPMLKKKKGHATAVRAKVVEIPKVKVASTSTLVKLLGLD